jgi:RNA polymerase sigma factor (sigma-70 family)
MQKPAKKRRVVYDDQREEFSYSNAADKSLFHLDDPAWQQDWAEDAIEMEQQEAERQARIQDAYGQVLAALSKREQLVFVLYHVEEWNVDEIAQMLGRTRSMVFKNLSAGRRKVYELRQVALTALKT